MSIPNISTLYQKILKGSEGGKEFARILNQLLISDGKDKGYETIISDDSSGDYRGVDAILKEEWRNSEKYTYTGVQYKFFPSALSYKHKSEIRKSLANAIAKFPEMSVWLLITPEDFLINDSKWFDQLKDEFEYILSMEEAANRIFNKITIDDKNELQLYHWGHSEIINLMLTHPEIGNYYYNQDLFIKESGKLFLSKISVDTLKTNWVKSQRNNLEFVQRGIYGSDSVKSSELVFDIQFINNTDLIFHLHQIDIVIEKCWYDIKGIPSDEVLKSIGIIEYEIDFSKKRNQIILEEEIGGPIIFNYKSSKRFGLQLNRFTKSCPGNMAKISFKFLFNNDTIIRSEILTLNF
jgi:hypothetical protein